MFQIWKMLFPKLWFGIEGDPSGGGDPSGQPGAGEGNGDGTPGDGQAPTEIELGNVKVPKEIFEKVAKETFKDRFDAYENREKWQSENTRRAQEHADKLRKAELYDRMMAEGFPQRQPVNPLEAQKQQYIQEMKKDFPDLDERFLARQFDMTIRLAEMRGKELVEPIYAQSGERFERDFLQAHPKVQKGSPQYQEIGELIRAGVDPEKAYQTVFFEELLKEKLEAKTQEAIKKRDEDAKRKLQQSRTSGSLSAPSGEKKSFSQIATERIAEWRAKG